MPKGGIEEIDIILKDLKIDEVPSSPSELSLAKAESSASASSENRR